MAIPLPPADAAGGIMVIKYTSPSATHRLRLHTLAFGNDAAGLYTVPPAGGEAGIVATFNAFAAVFKRLYNNTWLISLDQTFKVVAGVVTEVFTVAPPAGVVGTNATAGTSPHETFISWNFHTVNGNKMRYFALSTTGWAFQAPYTVLAGDATDTGATAVLVTGATSGVLARDGTKPVLPCHVTYGLNKRLRRRWGDA
jgi:hypothetical protein